MFQEHSLFYELLAQTSPSPLGIQVSHAEGVFLYGPDGKKYFDLVSGVSVSNAGHKNPEVEKALAEQIQKNTHLMVYGELIQSPQVQYAEFLTSLLPPQLNNVYFVNSGAEA
ncbi:MAG: aminotransferase class III-fold pyridoxal phosphate-dependent enzyme, partial [Bacteroidales bacterium]|nr:aminotransferase class III-fold pyridoxal phosphate-dependent enzyme [Bacteroidales bacterium]